MSNRIAVDRTMLELEIRDILITWPECADLEFKVVELEQPQPSGCNWEVELLDQNVAGDCYTKFRAALRGLRTTTNLKV